MSARPTNKVAAGVLAGAIVAVLTWGVKAFAHVDTPAEVVVGLSTIITFGVQYLVPDAAQDSPSDDPNSKGSA